MCYKVATPSTSELFQEIYAGAPFTPTTVEPHFFVDGFTFPRLPVMKQGSGDIENMTWGLLPFWFDLRKERQKSIEAQQQKLLKAGKNIEGLTIPALPDDKLLKAFQTNTLNAKSEEVFIKPSWKMNIMKKRCTIYTTGFYEWRHFDNGKVKIPYFIYPAESKILRMGGLWSQWTHPETGEVFETFAIITVPANTLLSKIHNSKLRMPLLFNAQEGQTWLTDDLTKEQVLDMMRPCSESMLKSHTVDTLISQQIPVEMKDNESAQKETLYPDWIND